MLAVSLLGFAGLLPLGYAVLPGYSSLQPKLTPIQEKMSLHTSSAAFPHSSLAIAQPPPLPFPSPGFIAQLQHPAFSTRPLLLVILHLSALPLSFFLTFPPSLSFSLSKVLINSQSPCEV